MQLISKFTRTIIPPNIYVNPRILNLEVFFSLCKNKREKQNYVKVCSLPLLLLTYLSEFLQKSTKIMSSSSNSQLLFVFLKLHNSLSLVT